MKSLKKAASHFRHHFRHIAASSNPLPASSLRADHAHAPTAAGRQIRKYCLVQSIRSTAGSSAASRVTPTTHRTRPLQAVYSPAHKTHAEASVTTLRSQFKTLAAALSVNVPSPFPTPPVHDSFKVAHDLACSCTSSQPKDGFFNMLLDKSSE